LAQSGFIVADIDPGDRKITASPGYIPIGNSALAVNVKAGEVCYIKISQRIERTVYPLWARWAWLFGSLTRRENFASKLKPRPLRAKSCPK
jgi:hypothetical protein